MTDDTRPVGDDDIEAYIDGRLPDARLALVEGALAASADLRARVSADRALRDTLRERLAPIAAEPIPTRLRVAPIIARRRAAVRTRLGSVAAALLLLALGAGAGWETRGWRDARVDIAATGAVTTAADAISAHRVFVVETVHPVEVAASQQAHLVQWLSRRVGHALKVPDLSARGFELMGGRVIPEAGMAAAQFMYQDGEGHRLTLLVRTGGAAEAGFRFVQADGVSAFSWDDDGLSYAIVAGVDRAKLLSLAEATYRQLDPGQSVPPTRD